jgi:hypothetical protein
MVFCRLCEWDEPAEVGKQLCSFHVLVQEFKEIGWGNLWDSVGVKRDSLEEYKAWAEDTFPNTIATDGKILNHYKQNGWERKKSATEIKSGDPDFANFSVVRIDERLDTLLDMYQGPLQEHIDDFLSLDIPGDELVRLAEVVSSRDIDEVNKLALIKELDASKVNIEQFLDTIHPPKKK